AFRDAMTEDPDVITVDMQTTTARQATVVAYRIVLTSSNRREDIAYRARRLLASFWGGAPVPGSDPSLVWQAPPLALADTILASEPFTARAIARADFFHATGALHAFDTLIGAVAALPPQAASQHGFQLFDPSRARVLYVEPLDDDKRPLPGA